MSFESQFLRRLQNQTANENTILECADFFLKHSGLEPYVKFQQVVAQFFVELSQTPTPTLRLLFCFRVFERLIHLSDPYNKQRFCEAFENAFYEAAPALRAATTVFDQRIRLREKISELGNQPWRNRAIISDLRKVFLSTLADKEQAVADNLGINLTNLVELSQVTEAGRELAQILAENGKRQGTDNLSSQVKRSFHLSNLKEGERQAKLLGERTDRLKNELMEHLHFLMLRSLYGIRKADEKILLAGKMAESSQVDN
jgi:hypothetical protein